MRPYQQSFADPEGDFLLLDHASIERAIDEHLGLPSFEEVDAANLRLQRALSRGVPGSVELQSLSLELA